MTTISYLQDRNASMDYSSVGVTETDNSGATMTQGIELNIDKSKVTSKQEILEALEKIAKAVMESANLTG
jgi:hypothetical protein